MGELEIYSVVVLPWLSLNALEELGVNAQGQTESLHVTDKKELTQGDFDERKPGGSQLH